MHCFTSAVKILSMKTCRWDIRIGLFATLLAIAGLASSIIRRNEELLDSSSVSTAHQKLLLLFAVVIGVMTIAKWWQAKRTDKLRP